MVHWNEVIFCLVGHFIEVVELFTFQVFLRPKVGLFPKVVIHLGNCFVYLIPLPNLVVEHHDKLGEIDVAGFPFLQIASTVLSWEWRRCYLCTVKIKLWQLHEK